jgi:hypothetical protein
MFQKGKNLMVIKWTQEQHWQLLITTCHKIEGKRLTHKDKNWLKYLMSFLKRLLSTTSFNALCALEPFFIHFFVLAISEAIGSCAHVVTILP